MATRADCVLRLVLYGALAALAAAFSLQKIRSVDYWWQLATGAWIVRHGEVPRTDVFSYSVPGAPYVDIHWLFQVGLHGLHAAGGHAAVVMAKLVLVVLTLGLVALAIRRWDRPVVVVGALALGLCALSERITARPELLTFVLLAAELALLERFRRRTDEGEHGVRAVGAIWTIWALVPLHLLWANLHGLFMVGLGVIAIAFLGEAVDALRFGRREGTGRRLWTLSAVGALSALASLVNPNGPDGALYPVQQLFMIGSGGMREAVGLRSAELQSLVFHWHEVDPLVLSGFVGLAGGGGLALLVEWRRAPAFHALLLGVFVLLGLMAVRNVALLGVVGPLVLARQLGAALDRVRPPASVGRVAAACTVAALVALAWWTASGRLGLALRTVHAPGLGVVEHLFPEGAAEWIAHERPRGPVYHHMADGGYLIWRLHPEYGVLADGRLEVYGEQADFLFRTSAEGFRRLDRRFGFGVALLGHAHYEFGALLRALYLDHGWRLAYVDEVSAVFVRRPPGDEEPDLDVKAPDLFPPPPGGRSLADLFARIGRARFYTYTGQGMAAAREIHGLRLRYPAWVQGD